MALGTQKVGRWSRKAGGRCIQCSFCVEMSVHGNTVKSSWSLKLEVAYTRLYCSSDCMYENSKNELVAAMSALIC